MVQPDGFVVVVLVVVHLNRLLNRVARRVARQVLEMQIVAVDIADAAAEHVAELAVRVFSYRDEEIRAHIGGVDALSQFVGQTVRASIPEPITAVFLELIENDH